MNSKGNLEQKEQHLETANFYFSSVQKNCSNTPIANRSLENIKANDKKLIYIDKSLHRHYFFGYDGTTRLPYGVSGGLLNGNKAGFYVSLQMRPKFDDFSTPYIPDVPITDTYSKSEKRLFLMIIILKTVIMINGLTVVIQVDPQNMSINNIVFKERLKTMG